MPVICKEWYAWINTQPIGPKSLHVIGGLEVGNPGVDVLLTKRVTGNPSLLTLDVSLYQKPGTWIQKITCASASYHEVLPGNSNVYSAIEVVHGPDVIARIDSIDVAS